MEGRNQFTADEILKIRSLLKEKVRSSRSRQKGIRASLRRIGFYITDFDTSQSGFDNIDFDRLIETGRIQELTAKNQVSLEPDNRIPSSSATASDVEPESCDIEAKRRKYLPETIRVLMVGESPPAGGTFFYCGNSILNKCIYDAFVAVIPDMAGPPSHFLQKFSDLGFYLDDLCLIPVNHMSDMERGKEREKGIPELAKRIRNWKPRAVLTLMKAISGCIDSAIKISEIIPDYVESSSFPAGSEKNKRVCRSENTGHLNNLIEQGIVKVAP